MPKRCSYNYRLRNLATGETCGHHHHSQEKAQECIERFAWDPSDCVVERFTGADENAGKNSWRHERNIMRKMGLE